MNTKKIILISISIFIIITTVALIYFINQKNMSDNTKTNISTNSITELKIEDQTIGTGKEVKSGDTISIHYTGYLTDGTKFDSSVDRGVPFSTQIGVGRVIEGWDKGVVGMKEGGKRKLTIPYQMAYGENGYPPVIPAKATLIFEVELITVL